MSELGKEPRDFIRDNINSAAQVNHKKNEKFKSMSIKDILKDRQAKRVKDNLMQKEGYKDILEFIAQRRQKFKDYDVQEEEVKLLNGIKMHVDSGWVVDNDALKQLFAVSGV